MCGMKLLPCLMKLKNMRKMIDWPKVVTLGVAKDEGLRDDEIVAFLDEADAQRYSLSQTILTEELALFREAMWLQTTALSFAADNSSQWSAQDRAEVALMARVCNLLRAKSKLLLFGYRGECFPIDRAIHECSTRVLLFHWYPAEADRFLEGKYRKQEYVDKKLAAKLTNGVQNDTERELRELYTFETRRAHPYPESVELQTFGTERDIGSHAVLGGVGTKELIRLIFIDLLHGCLVAAKILGVIGLHKATADWSDRYAIYEVRVLRLTAKYKKYFVERDVH